MTKKEVSGLHWYGHKSLSNDFEAAKCHEFLAFVIKDQKIGPISWAVLYLLAFILTHRIDD